MIASRVATLAEMTLAQTGAKPIARILNDRHSVDFAYQWSVSRLVVVRCVEHADANDHLALRTMIREGDFDRALLVHIAPATIPSPPDVETCTLDELPAVLARWERSL